MKQILIALLMSLSLPAWGLDQSNSTLQFASGFRSLNGLIGINYEKMLTENYALQAGTGVDIIGPVISLGYRYFDGPIAKHTNTFLDKCLFLFECDAHPYVGLSLQYAPSTHITVEAEDTVRSTYAANDRYLALGVFGIRDVFRNKVILDVNFTYKEPLNKSHVTNTDGPDVEKQREVIHAMEKGLGLGLSLGYLF